MIRCCDCSRSLRVEGWKQRPWRDGNEVKDRIETERVELLRELDARFDVKITGYKVFLAYILANANFLPPFFKRIIRVKNLFEKTVRNFHTKSRRIMSKRKRKDEEEKMDNTALQWTCMHRGWQLGWEKLPRDRSQVLDLDYLEETAPPAKYCAASRHQNVREEI